MDQKNTLCDFVTITISPKPRKETLVFPSLHSAMMEGSSHKQPEYSFQFTDVQSIDFKDHFTNLLYNDPADTQTLRTLQKFGQLNPLLVQQQTENRYHLLADYPYFIAIKALGIDKIVCKILPYSTPAVTLFSLQVLHNLSSSPQSPLVHAHLLRDAQHILSEEELLQLLSLMGYKPQRHKIDELIGFLQLDSSAILALHRGILSQKSAKQLARLSHKDQQYLVNLISKYRLGGSKQQKLVEMVMELVLTSNSSVVEIINKGLPIQEKDSTNIPQQVHGLMQYLHEQCYPGNTAAEKMFKKLVQELRPSEEVSIEHSLSFEDESLEVRLKFTDAASLRKNWDKIKMIVP